MTIVLFRNPQEIRGLSVKKFNLLKIFISSNFKFCQKAIILPRKSLQGEFLIFAFFNC
jgi:hypothetical protein